MKRLTSTAIGGVLLVVVWVAPAVGHDRSISYSSWEIQGRRARVTVRLTQLELSRLPWVATAGVSMEAAVGAYLAQRLRLTAGENVCRVVDVPRPLPAAAGRAVYEWRLECPPHGDLRLESTLLLEVAPSHLHFARVIQDGGPPLERVLSDAERSWMIDGQTTVDGRTAARTSLRQYVGLGVNHIWTGYDHLAFLLALLLIGGSLGEAAKVVAGFTVAHSITLALAVLGYARPARAPIEALIGLSIVLVAAENAWLTSGRGRVLPGLIAAALAGLALAATRGHGQVPALTLLGLAVFVVGYFGLVARLPRPVPLRWAIAFVFGLVHGFGFAAVLLAVDVPAARLAEALFGFNVGVEFGQLVAIVLIWPLLRRAMRTRPRVDGLIVELGSAAALALGIFWFVTRAYG